MADNPVLPIIENVPTTVGSAPGLIKELTFVTQSTDTPATLVAILNGKDADGNWDSRVPLVPVKVQDTNESTAPDPDHPGETITVPAKSLANAIIGTIMEAVAVDGPDTQYILAATGIDVRGLSNLDMGRLLFPHLMP